ncbi:unnamed protein product [Acanthoscelides obtectus]|uniref:HTH psq-type domain-containing protein n=1 Tax=Acanthoscelides obtectus TaxID=200917 RepID=A0A9P0M336_ACAOB|nr:unnamed protein product [Acanthoscelides obtectus]CAH2019299.1 unnamed protein product [Acanthoscelides obtectus]CAK1650701.1 hypothetical protein AOBTE_LOCUS16872 [Acanthoscelides obtectus]CAK1689108.1 hypothetical protein AOBTE_LOCUS37014 [Acanthoscelides obtectus]
MPKIYKRKSLERAKWTEEQLKSAMSTVKDEGLSVRQAGKTFGIPRKTLERRKYEDHKKKLDPDTTFGAAHENRLVRHIKEMRKVDFHLLEMICEP